jgi:hypothetical protein
MKKKFWDVFQQNSNGSISPKKTIKIAGVTLSLGVSFTKGVTFGGIDFFNSNYYGKDLEIEEEGDILVIKGIYTS